MPFFRSSRILICLLPALSLVGVGCSSNDRPQTESDKNFKALTVLYGKFVSRNRGMGPASEADFKKFIKSLGSGEVEAAGANPAEIDKLFVSPRDNEPYEFAWKSQANTGPDGKGTVVMWEKTGVGGKRLVGDSNGAVEELDAAAFEQRVGNKAAGKTK